MHSEEAKENVALAKPAFLLPLPLYTLNASASHSRSFLRVILDMLLILSCFLETRSALAVCDLLTAHCV